MHDPLFNVQDSLLREQRVPPVAVKKLAPVYLQQIQLEEMHRQWSLPLEEPLQFNFAPSREGSFFRAIICAASYLTSFVSFKAISYCTQDNFNTLEDLANKLETTITVIQLVYHHEQQCISSTVTSFGIHTGFAISLVRLLNGTWVTRLLPRSAPPLLTMRRVQEAKQNFKDACQDILQEEGGGEALAWLKQQVQHLGFSSPDKESVTTISDRFPISVCVLVVLVH
jgi:hypothetical protein